MYKDYKNLRGLEMSTKK